MEPPPPAFEDIYDDDILARIDRQLLAAGEAAEAAPAEGDENDGGPADEATGWLPAADEGEQPVVPRYPRARRLGVGGAMLAGAMVGVADVLEPGRARQHIVEYVPDEVDEDQQLVTFRMVPGDPGASRIIVRPWLLERFRLRRA